MNGSRLWEELGATYLTVRTSSYPVVWSKDLPPSQRSVAADKHLEALRRFKAAWDAR